MKKIIYTSSLALLLVFTGCKTNNHVIKCPDIFAAKAHHPMLAKAPHIGEYNAVRHISQPKEKNEAIASVSNEISGYELKVPRIAAEKLNDNELEDVNGVFVKYSGDKVHLERRANGRIYLRANSVNDFFKLATSLAALKKSNPAALPPDARGAVAIAGGVIGIIALVFSLGPFVSYGAFLLGLIAIILGAVGLRSSRPGWAIAGIVLGVLAIVFAAVFGVGVYTIILHI